MPTLYRLKPMVMTEQARENRAYVRRLLREKQPEFAAMLELAAAGLLAELQGADGSGSAAVSCQCR